MWRSSSNTPDWNIHLASLSVVEFHAIHLGRIIGCLLCTLLHYLFLCSLLLRQQEETVSPDVQIKRVSHSLIMFFLAISVESRMTLYYSQQPTFCVAVRPRHEATCIWSKWLYLTRVNNNDERRWFVWSQRYKSRALLQWPWASIYDKLYH